MAKRLKVLHSTPLEQRPRAIIIGASSGLGAALARKLSEEGYILAVLARRIENLETLCKEINQNREEQVVFAYQQDVTDFESTPNLFQKIIMEIGGVDLVIYSAGAMPEVDFSEFNFQKDKQMVDVNLLGAMAWLGQAALYFQQIGSGQIVGISSVAGDRGRVGNPGYGASKAGHTTYLESLRNRVTRFGVKVLTIKPGPMDTEMTAGKEAAFMISAEQAAEDIVKAIRKKKQNRYVPRRWWFIMLVIILIPSFIFRRLKI